MKIKLFILIFILAIFWACESPMTPDIEGIIEERKIIDPPVISFAANVIFDGYVECECPYIYFFEGHLRNIGNLTAINIEIHVPLFNSSGIKIGHLTHLFIHGYYNSSRLESGQTYTLDFRWELNRDLCNQIDLDIKGFYITWDDEK